MEPTSILLVLAVVAAVALLAGGHKRRDAEPAGPAAGPLVATWYSASDGYGGYFVPPGGAENLRRMSPDPVAMVSAAGPVQCINRSHNGMRLRELINGGRLANGLPEVLGADGVTVEPLRRQLAVDKPDIAVIGAGMVDWAFDHISAEEYRALLGQAASAASDQGVALVFLGFSRFGLSDVITPQIQARLAEGDSVLRRVASELNVPYIDRSSVEPIMGWDGLHVVPECHQQAAPIIATQLAKIAAYINHFRREAQA